MSRDYLLDMPEGSSHSPVGGSVMHRILSCPGSVYASHGVPVKEAGPWADEGSFAHLFAEMRLLNPTDPTLKTGWTHTDWPGQVVDADMQYQIGRYVTYVKQIQNSLENADLLVERKVDYTHLIRNGVGTGDVVVVNHEELHIIDLKYGKGDMVEAHENDQLLTYATAEYHRLNLLYDFTKVVLHIVQPRREHFDSWETDVARLIEHEAAIRKAADLIVSDNPPFNPGEKQCKYCAAPPCAAQINQLKADFDDLPDVATVQAKPVTEYLDIIPRIPMYTKMFKVMQERLEEELRQGIPHPDWKLVRGRAGSRAWNPELDEQQIIDTLTKFVDAEALYTDPVLKSPAQVEKEIKTDKEAKDALKALVVQPDGKITFAPASDKRPAVDISNIADEFDTVDADDPLDE